MSASPQGLRPRAITSTLAEKKTMSSRWVYKIKENNSLLGAWSFTHGSK